MSNAACRDRNQGWPDHRRAGMSAGIALYRHEASHWKGLAQTATTPPVRDALLKRARECERSAAALEAYRLLPWEGAA